MKIPENEDERHRLYKQTIRQCEISRSDRRARARRLRQLFIVGSDEDERVRYNKLEEYVKFSTSYLYSETSTKFGVAYPPHYGDTWVEELEAFREELHRYWHDSSASGTFGLGVKWAHVWDSVVFKVILTRNEPELTMIPDPSDVGVWNEYSNSWDRQEAVVHWYQLDTASFRRWVESHPRSEELAEMAERSGTPSAEAHREVLPATVQRIILASANPTMVGAVNAAPDLAFALPRVAAPMVRMAELWIWDDDVRDYRVVQHFLNAEEIVFDRVNPLLSGRHPFYDLTLDPVPGYLWGRCPLESLLRLQKWREAKMDSLDLRDELQLNPPIFFEGMSTLDGEKAKAFRRPGGNITTATPNAKMTPMVPSPLPDAFSFIEQIDLMFARLGGLPKAMTGESMAGVRSADQTLMQAILGSGPTMDYAMRVEKCLESIATDMMHLWRRVSPTPLMTSRGDKFLLSQLPDDFVARVWGHSSSPLFAQQTVEKAMMAKQLGAIDGESLLDYLDLPLTENLKAKARMMLAGGVETKERMLQAKEKEAEARLIGAKLRALKGSEGK